MDSITVEARAKINLFLNVGKKRADGYHDIDTVMTAVDLCDTVMVTKCGESGIFLDCLSSDKEIKSELDSLAPEKNIACKAAELFFGKLGLEGFGVNIRIEKRIPVCAGLAGGSTDAAAVLKCLNSLWGEPYSMEELCGIASEAGADVAFCVAGGTKLCRGRGEIMTAVDGRLPLHGLIVPEKTKKLSTGVAYGLVDNFNEGRESNKKSSEAVVTALKNGDYSMLCKEIYNVFEEACGYGSRAKHIMLEGGADACALSGAGASFFALYSNEEKMKKSVLSLEREGYKVYSF